jgi:hypothetical protein
MRRSAGRPRHTHRHLTIHTPELSNRGGSFKQCLLAYIYSPFLVFTYSALEPLKIKEGESAIEFSSRCQFVTAQHLGIGVSTVHWKEQHRALQALGYSKVGTLAFCPLSMTPFLPSFLRSFLRSFLPSLPTKRSAKQVSDEYWKDTSIDEYQKAMAARIEQDRSKRARRMSVSGV